MEENVTLTKKEDIEEKPKEKKVKTDLSKVRDMLNNMSKLVNTGHKYYDHMDIQELLLDMKNTNNIKVLYELNNEIISICENPRTPRLNMERQLKLAKLIKKELNV